MADLLFLGILLVDLFMIGTTRLGACIRASALQGLLLAALPLVFHHGRPDVHLAALVAGPLLFKAVAIPKLLLRALETASVRREVEPMVSLHASLVCGAALIGFAFWLGEQLVLPTPPPSELAVPAAFSTLLLGFLVLVSRTKAITQVIGYLMLENGVYMFGLGLASAMPLVIELGILLDVWVGVFVMGIAIFHIDRTFDHIDTDRLIGLKG
ncbi:MAG: hydrogenase [Candidatus Binatia bacterium]